MAIPADSSPLCRTKFPEQVNRREGYDSAWGRHLLRYAQSVTSQRSSGSAATRFARRQRYRIPLGTSRPAVDAPARGNGYNLNRSDFSRPLPSQTSKR
jgi:hypothetical protein